MRSPCDSKSKNLCRVWRARPLERGSTVGHPTRGYSGHIMMPRSQLNHFLYKLMENARKSWILVDFPYPSPKTKWAVFPYKFPYKLHIFVRSKIMDTQHWDMGINSYVSKAFFYYLPVCFYGNMPNYQSFHSEMAPEVLCVRHLPGYFRSHFWMKGLRIWYILS